MPRSLSAMKRSQKARDNRRRCALRIAPLVKMLERWACAVNVREEANRREESRRGRQECLRYVGSRTASSAPQWKPAPKAAMHMVEPVRSASAAAISIEADDVLP